MGSTDAPIIVCGMGQCGFRVARILRRLGKPVTAISLATRDDWIRQAEEEGIKVIVGDARDVRLLDAAGLSGAQALLAVTDQDPINIEIALHAKRTRDDLVVVIRIFDQTLARRLESALDVRRALAMSALAAPSFAAAVLGDDHLGAFDHEGTPFWVGRLPIPPDSELTQKPLRDLEIARRLAPLMVVRGGHGMMADPSETLRVGDDLVLAGPMAGWDNLREGPAGGSPPQDAPGPGRGARGKLGAIRALVQLLMGTSRAVRVVFLVLNLLILLSVFVFQSAMDLSFVDALYFIVTTVTTTGYGDITPVHSSDFLKLYAALVMILGSATLATLYSLITDLIVTTRFREVLGKQQVPRSGHVVVVGLGNVGYRVLDELGEAGVPVIAIERDPGAELVGAVESRGEVVLGDARSPDVLERAGVAQARALAAVTGDDAVNLGVSLAAREMNTEMRTVTRLFDADLARQTQAALRIDAVLSASAIAAPTFAAASLYPNVLCGLVVADRMLVLYRQVVQGDWAGLTPAELADRHGVVVVASGPQSQGPFAAAPERALSVDDHVLVGELLPLAPDPPG